MSENVLKGIALSTIAGLILAIFGVAILIGIFAVTFGSTHLERLFCSAYQKVSFLIPAREGGNPPTPKICLPKEEFSCEREIEEFLSRDVSMKIASEITRCWNKFKGYGNVTKTCCALEIKNLQGFVNESLVNDVLISQNLCPSVIENSEFEHGSGSPCGTENQILFEFEKIERGNYVVVKYKNGKVIVE